jgi:hypothetical protein
MLTNKGCLVPRARVIGDSVFSLQSFTTAFSCCLLEYYQDDIIMKSTNPPNDGRVQSINVPVPSEDYERSRLLSDNSDSSEPHIVHVQAKTAQFTNQYKTYIAAACIVIYFLETFSDYVVLARRLRLLEPSKIDRHRIVQEAFLQGHKYIRFCCKLSKLAVLPQCCTVPCNPPALSQLHPVEASPQIRFGRNHP